jgi:small-conductance mechanosensitive channel
MTSSLPPVPTPPPSVPELPDVKPTPRLGGLRRSQWIILAALAALISSCVGFGWATRSAMGSLSFLRNPRAATAGTGHKTLVDINPWLTAQALSALAVTTEEKDDALEAERQADHEVDQAFASALRLSAAKSRKMTPEAQAINQRVLDLQQVVAEDTARLASLTAASGSKASGADAPPDSDEVEVAKAQLGLDSDNLADAQQDLARAVDDDSVRIQQELTAHEAMMKKYDAHAQDPGELAVISTQRNGSLASRIEAWFNQRSRKSLILQAQAEAANGVASLTAEHNALEAKVNAAPASGAQATGASRVADLKAKAAQRQLLSIYDDRIDTDQQLAAIYGKWAAQVDVQHTIVLHLMLWSVALIAFIGLCVVLVDALIAYLLERSSSKSAGNENAMGTSDPRRRQTLKTILQVSVQVVGAVLSLGVIFGKPQQLSTILGLATAGLTVALQSYILAFCGWFVLMGRNGIRVGDAVEIDTVHGKVLDIGLFRTTLLETGNWTANGHPTGRRVAFMNTFAVNGRYFNFSTVGQWLWDEIKISVPASDDTYAVIEQIHQAVLKETAEDAKRAEQEWQGAGRQSGLSEFSAAPMVNLRPAANGVDLVVRYVTRAAARFETRNCLYQVVLDVLRSPTEAAPLAPATA